LYRTRYRIPEDVFNWHGRESIPEGSDLPILIIIMWSSVHKILYTIIILCITLMSQGLLTLPAEINLINSDISVGIATVYWLNGWLLY
jgi:hypothetical protein